MRLVKFDSLPQRVGVERARDGAEYRTCRTCADEHALVDELSSSTSSPLQERNQPARDQLQLIPVHEVSSVRYPLNGQLVNVPP